MKWLTHTSVALLLVAVAACGSSDIESGRIDLLSAESMAREEVGEDAVLFSVSSGTDSPMGADGYAESWEFTYRLPSDPDPNAARSITVTANEVISSEMPFVFVPSNCNLEDSPQPLDSRRVVPDAMRRLEQADNPVRLEEGGTLSVRQIPFCWYAGVPIDFYYAAPNMVAYSGPTTWSIVEYDDDGRFVYLFTR